MLWIQFMEYLLVGCTILAFMTMAMQIRAAIKNGTIHMKDPHPINIFDYLTKQMPKGTFSVRQPLEYAWEWCGGILGLTGFSWILVCIPQMFIIAVVYLFMSVIVMIVGIADYIDPDTYMIAAIGYGFGKWDEQIIYGFLIALPFVLLSTFNAIYFKGLQLENLPLASFIVTVILIPIVEEALFRGVLAPIIAEQAGLLHGVLISAFLFSVFHAYAYHLNIIPMMIAFAFGAIAALVDLYFKSIVPSTIAHSLINLVAFMAMV